MKVLILSCNTGGGHNSAAAAIKDHIEKNGSRCDIVNALDFLPKAKARLDAHNVIWHHFLGPESLTWPLGQPLA